MVNRTNQSTVIKEAINSYLDKGLSDKQDIYTKVVDDLGVPRPTVRRVARDLRNELLEKIRILQSEALTPSKSSKEINEYTDGEETVLCPKCHVDAILPHITDKEELKKIHNFWLEKQ